MDKPLENKKTTSSRPTRRLAAIMFTDIEGYTALMQKSERTALLYRETHRRIFNSNTEKYNGRIIQYYGDGTLSIFESALDAVLCGIALQREFQQSPHIPVRPWNKEKWPMSRTH